MLLLLYIIHRKYYIKKKVADFRLPPYWVDQLYRAVLDEDE